MERDYTINRMLRKYIQRNGMKQGEIADRAGISRAVFSNLVNCKRVIYADELIPILTAAGMPLESVIAAMASEEKGA